MLSRFRLFHFEGRRHGLVLTRCILIGSRLLGCGDCFRPEVQNSVSLRLRRGQEGTAAYGHRSLRDDCVAVEDAAGRGTDG